MTQLTPRDDIKKQVSEILKLVDNLIRNGQVVFSNWFVQLIRWYLGRPSDLQVLKNYSQKRLLLHADNHGNSFAGS